MDTGRYKTVGYTPGISTTELIKRCAERAQQMGYVVGAQNGGGGGVGGQLTALLEGLGFKAAIIAAAIFLHSSLQMSQVQGVYEYSSAAAPSSPRR